MKEPASPADAEPPGDTAAAPAEEPSQQPEPAGGAPVSRAGNEGGADAPFAAWSETLEILNTLDAPLRGFLNDSAAVVHGDFVLVDCANAMFGELIRHSSHQRPLKEAVQKASGRPYKVGILKKSTAQPSWDDDPLNEILRNASAQGLGIKEKGQKDT